ncbi:MAG: Polar-differentiation response regulator DivK [Chroococcidiopsis cubana SAG 39.79]|uniref:Response regulator n=1 Tax=Chroococcidiopsis cubana SAG 39.79 TaxID=388085 RepID=A0AB37U8B3_9CYAN|nr:response regulator [Chroococcidiopsis cubana]MDZ4871978.1 Polar-differentiation response regulator DivK [Chroococcidiopsis cubana SAG 39.79]RUS94410.1 response regulator [Chroococcidiopsis cubana SAG 39.79]
MDSQFDNSKQVLVLAVEDGADNLELMIQVLEIIGFPLVTATDGRTAIAMAQQHQPDLILLDMVLPDMTGVEVAQRLKQDSRTAKIPIVAVTAMVAEEEKGQYLSAGCIDFVAKPYDIEFLETVIKRYVS